MTLRTCVTCVFSRPPLTDDGMEHRPEDDRPFLFCQRFPPTLPGPLDAFPAVSPGEVCGEWCDATDACDTLDGDTASLEATLDFLAEEIIAIRTTLDALTATLRPTSIVLRPDTP